MKINEALTQAMLSHERAFKNVSEAQALKIVKLTLAEIAREIDETEEGRVSVPGFATFTIKQVQREKDGEKTATKRVTVRMKARKAESGSDSDANDD